MAKNIKIAHNINHTVNTQNLQHLLRQLIDIYSPSGKEEDILEYVHNYLGKHDLPVIRQAVDESRYNLIVMPRGTEPQVVLVGHLDTVVAYDLDHYGYERKDDTVTGLGSADMKGGCAAMIESYIHAWKQYDSKIPAALALVVGEEEEGDGAQKLVEDFHFPWAIIGEPTNLHPCLSHYGYLEIQMLTRGKRMHASLANSKQNPIEAMLKLLLEFSTYIQEKRSELVYNIRDLFSPHAGFVVPDYCEAWIDTHIPPESPIGEITFELEELMEQYQQKNPYLNMVLRFTTIYGGYDIPEKGTFVELLKDIYSTNDLPWKPQAFRSHSDASILWEAGIKPIIIGPGNLEQAHVPDEYIAFDQVFRAAELYYYFVSALCSTI